MASERAEATVFRETLAPGGGWSAIVKRHQVLRLTDTDGGANVSALFYNADELLERYNMPDTLKAQYTAFLTRGRVLMSDMGRVLCSVVGDTCGWHDTICGHSDGALVDSKYGRKRYQEARNDFYRNARDTFLIELGKHGLGKQDIVANVNFFSKVATDADGRFSFVAEHSRPGALVDLRAEMNVLVVLAAVPHPLDTAKTYRPRPVEIAVLRGAPPGPDDACRVSRAETRRAFENTERYFQ
ncbi:MAG TPA: urea amidolyase associated protein UAAP1 [Polyangiaceae bacterium]|jgi:urea carboxylase-associated protein 2|nr:urea amidolyase associated protein UAAP1 [Polyangiaceae bacterium]